MSFYLDDDFNPLNSNDQFLKQMAVPGNGAAYVSYATVSLTLDATNATPGYHALYGKITGGGRTRYLYAPELVQIISSRQPPTLDIAKLNASQFRIGVNGVAGQSIVLQDSTNLTAWLPLATNTLADSRWTHTNTPPGSPWPAVLPRRPESVKLFTLNDGLGTNAAPGIRSATPPAVTSFKAAVAQTPDEALSLPETHSLPVGPTGFLLGNVETKPSCPGKSAQAFGGPFMNGVNRSIGTGKKVVVLCSLEISRMVWRKRSCRAIGSLLIIAAA